MPSRSTSDSALAGRTAVPRWRAASPTSLENGAEDRFTKAGAQWPCPVRGTVPALHFGRSESRVDAAPDATGGELLQALAVLVDIYGRDPVEPTSACRALRELRLAAISQNTLPSLVELHGQILALTESPPEEAPRFLDRWINDFAMLQDPDRVVHELQPWADFAGSNLELVTTYEVCTYDSRSLSFVARQCQAAHIVAVNLPSGPDGDCHTFGIYAGAGRVHVFDHQHKVFDEPRPLTAHLMSLCTGYGPGARFIFYNHPEAEPLPPPPRTPPGVTMQTPGLARLVLPASARGDQETLLRLAAQTDPQLRANAKGVAIHFGRTDILTVLGAAGWAGAAPAVYVGAVRYGTTAAFWCQEAARWRQRRIDIKEVLQDATFRDAVADYGDVAALEVLLLYGEPNAAQIKRITERAALHGHFGILRTLETSGVDCRWGELLRVAAQGGQSSLTETLLNKRPDLGDTTFLEAAAANQANVCGRLLSRMAPSTVQKASIAAAENGADRTLRTLGARASAECLDANTLLQIGAARGHGLDLSWCNPGPSKSEFRQAIEQVLEQGAWGAFLTLSWQFRQAPGTCEPIEADVFLQAAARALKMNPSCAMHLIADAKRGAWDQDAAVLPLLQTTDAPESHRAVLNMLDDWSPVSAQLLNGAANTLKETRCGREFLVACARRGQHELLRAVPQISALPRSVVHRLEKAAVQSQCLQTARVLARFGVLFYDQIWPDAATSLQTTRRRGLAEFAAWIEATARRR